MGNLVQKWDLDSLYPGGSKSKELLETIERTGRELDIMEAELSSSVEISVENLALFIESLQEHSATLDELMNFAACLEASDTGDEDASILIGRIESLNAQVNNMWTLVDDVITNLAPEKWELLQANVSGGRVAFSLSYRRQIAAQKLPTATEVVTGDLAVAGYHAWGSLYNQIAGQMKVTFEEEGEMKTLSLGQASNRLYNSDRIIRERAFLAIEEGWRGVADLTASALNNLSGFKLALYKHRKWSHLQEALYINRTTHASVDAMWAAVDKVRPKLCQVLQRKAQLMQIDRLTWFDLWAPLGDVRSKVPFAEAANIVIEQFGAASKEMAEYAGAAIRNRWVESEDRPGKLPGAFCGPMMKHGQERVFMTYDGTPSGISTLAHELGHAYHFFTLRDLPYLAKETPSNLAETASVFAELLVAKALMERATTQAERISLLSDRMLEAVSLLMDIRARYLFEETFMTAREAGPVSKDDLCSMMTQAQQTAFGNSLKRYNPMFWASKLHYYDTHTPFYNFPYTFGFLFGLGLMKVYESDRQGFARRYRALLEDTGSMTAEDLARKYLDADLTRPEYWESALSTVLQEADEFLDLTTS